MNSRRMLLAEGPACCALIGFTLTMFPFLFLPLVAAALQPDAALSPKQAAAEEKSIKALIVDLGDGSFDKREAAQQRLHDIGVPALRLLQGAVKDGADLETRERAAQLVRVIGKKQFASSLKSDLWGTSVDPKSDCLFRVDATRLHIQIPGKPHNLAAELGANTAPRVLRALEGDFHAEVSVLSGSPSEKRGLSGTKPWHGAGLLIWQDDKNYIRLERARVYVSGENWRCYANWKLREGAALAKQGGEQPLDPDKPVHFKLERKANMFVAEHSQDGKNWAALPPIKVALEKRLYVGVTASHNAGAEYEAIFDGFRLAKSP